MDEAERKENRKEYDLSEMLKHPEDYSEEELRAFFRQPEHKADYRLFRLMQMARTRERLDAPDTGRAWARFKRDFMPPQPKRRTRCPWKAAIGGFAVAAACGLFLYLYIKPIPPVATSLVAMEYDDIPQLVILQDDGKAVESFAQKDSISFLPSPAPVVKTEVQPKKPAKVRTLSTPRGVDFKVTLPDGTEVWLNAESSLQFPSAFTSETRKVILNGEAYFKVARNEQCPFIVETDKMQVRVLGTEFNFRNYHSEKPLVSLIDGSISIVGHNASASDIVLRPGQGASVEEDGSIHVLPQIDTYGTIQWVKGYFYFQNRPLVEILQELGRWYNVGVVFEETSGMYDMMHFSSLRSATLEEALEHLNRLRRVRIELEENRIVVR